MMALAARLVTEEIMLTAVASGMGSAEATLNSSTTCECTVLSAALSEPELSLVSPEKARMVAEVFLMVVALNANMTSGVLPGVTVAGSARVSVALVGGVTGVSILSKKLTILDTNLLEKFFIAN